MALHRHAGHAEAVARIRWCISETALGVITGEVGAGKTVALAVLAELDGSRHTVIYLPNPAVGARGLYACPGHRPGRGPRFHTVSLIAQTMDHLSAEKHERGRAVIVAVDTEQDRVRRPAAADVRSPRGDLAHDLGDVAARASRPSGRRWSAPPARPRPGPAARSTGAGGGTVGGTR